jgi:hypothetical protein
MRFAIGLPPHATLTFDGGGKLARVAEGGKLRPGPRPICQATKLLDPDPLVRRMAEAVRPSNAGVVLGRKVRMASRAGAAFKNHYLPAEKGQRQPVTAQGDLLLVAHPATPVR